MDMNTLVLLLLGINGLTIFKKDMVFRVAAILVSFGVAASMATQNFFILLGIIFVIIYQIKKINEEKK